ncbi:hypothetical protein WR25_07137 [Diploscapter pachys]|uniref:BPL/LPL catalytic domain-containing protein n=1 Tax=Diploscapter pachys TaxID=2018661 RepID=A0A2A2JES6_9BILA|nr:hypothetical protein WR25_07137 [Diploscapter pachys]
MCDTVVRRGAAKIYLSTCRCIYRNLAFEEFLFRNHNLEKQPSAMLLWSNNPAVVIGRHQNPWVEANLDFLHDFNIDLARRHSGGGTVYHDRGNLNISFITSHKDHCRPKNLRFLADFLNRNFGLQIAPTKRDDMELPPRKSDETPRKISGTAARIARGRAYHHLTLLVDSKADILKAALKSPFRDQIETNASKSVRAAKVGCMREDKANISLEEVRRGIIKAFKEGHEECEVEHVDVQKISEQETEVVTNLEELLSWEWRYGKTPKFIFTTKNGHLKVEVEKGKISKIEGNAHDRHDLIRQRFDSSKFRNF